MMSQSMYCTIETTILKSGRNFQLLPELTKTVKYKIWQVLYHRGIGHHKTNIAMSIYFTKKECSGGALSKIHRSSPEEV